MLDYKKIPQDLRTSICRKIHKVTGPDYSWLLLYDFVEDYFRQKEHRPRSRALFPSEAYAALVLVDALAEEELVTAFMLWKFKT